MKWKHTVLEAAAGIVLMALPVHAQTQITPKDRDQRVLWFIHQVNLFEIETANLANAKSNSQDVKDFANHMITDHTQADQQVRAYAQAHDIDLDAIGRHLAAVSADRLANEREVKAVGTATGEWAYSWEHANVAKDDAAKTLDQLRSVSGSAFDRAYVSAMAKGHQDAVNRLTDVRDRGIDPGLRKMIDSLLPTIKHHLEMAQALQGVLSKA